MVAAKADAAAAKLQAAKQAEMDRKARRRMLGNIIFIGTLYMKVRRGWLTHGSFISWPLRRRYARQLTLATCVHLVNLLKKCCSSLYFVECSW